MLKFAIAAAVAGMVSIAPAFAGEMLHCDDASMKMLDGMIHKAAADPAMKPQAEMAMAEEHTAMNAMHKKHMKTCATHLNMAEKDLMAH
jgi:hypothetical protein